MHIRHTFVQLILGDTQVQVSDHVQSKIRLKLCNKQLVVQQPFSCFFMTWFAYKLLCERW